MMTVYILGVCWSGFSRRVKPRYKPGQSIPFGTSLEKLSVAWLLTTANVLSTRTLATNKLSSLAQAPSHHYCRRRLPNVPKITHNGPPRMASLQSFPDLSTTSASMFLHFFMLLFFLRPKGRTSMLFNKVSPTGEKM